MKSNPHCLHKNTLSQEYHSLAYGEPIVQSRNPSQDGPAHALGATPRSAQATRAKFPIRHRTPIIDHRGQKIFPSHCRSPIIDNSFSFPTLKRGKIPENDWAISSATAIDGQLEEDKQLRE